jgi:hypothetical protein
MFEVRIGLNLRLSHEPSFECCALSLVHGSYREVDAGGSISIRLSRPSWFSDSVFGDFFVAKPQGILRLVREPMFHLRPGSSDLGLVASNAFHYFFKLAADRRLRMAGLFPNRDFQISKLFVDVDELETNLSTERIYMRTHGEPLAGNIRRRPHCYAALRPRRVKPAKSAKIPARQSGKHIAPTVRAE